MKHVQRSLLSFCLAAALLTSCNHRQADKPKLVIGIVVDQMRWDYLYRYADKYSQNGFKRIMSEGYNCQNTHINYTPSYTGPGHACVYTGSVPAIHGIAGNAWYDRDRKAKVNCVDDPLAKTVGPGSIDGHISPRNLLSTTITDELQLATNFKSKVVAIALKDRSAVLPGGHHPTGAYFVDANTGNFISTTYYMPQLPPWVNAFNNKNLAHKYLDHDWNTLLPINQYTESTVDSATNERAYEREEKPVFPHHLAKISRGHPDVISYTPFGNSLTLDFAKAAIEGENLGQSNSTDFLAISLSSTDLVGHQFGPNSIEAEDCFLRLDRDLANFFSYLDEKVGKGNYLIFLTADHGAAHSEDFLRKNGIPAGSFNIDSVTAELSKVINAKYGEGDWILSHENMQLYLNRPLMEEKKITQEEIFNISRTYLMNYEAISDLIDLKHLSTTSVQPQIKAMLSNGYNLKRSGDLQILYNPSWVENFALGATHGTAYAYDTHIPLLFMGWKVKHGEDHSEIYMTDIAPTITAMLHIQEPSGCVGKVIQPLIK
ncbi:MAG: alkaline phosphatase family protein [Bacteroidota bacterium]|nr:alkaline phosphatase family protein [Bacteroidota bacterium]